MAKRYKPAVSECEIQAEFYLAAKAAGITLRLEIGTRCGRPDAIMQSVDGTGAHAIIEVKKGISSLCYKQLARYRWLGLPVYTLCRLCEIDRLVERLLRVRNEFPAKPWGDLVNKL